LGHFSAEALSPSGALETFLDESARYGSDLGTLLRERIYGHDIPSLALALAKAQKLDALTQQQLADTCLMALTVLFRLLLEAYAEDRDLRPYKTHELYRSRSLREKATELAKLAERGVPFDASSSHREETWRLFGAVKGSGEWGVPAYNGGLFSENPAVSHIGAALAKLPLSNHEFGPVLRWVLVDEGEEGFVPADFRSLGVRHLGTIYEGLQRPLDGLRRQAALGILSNYNHRRGCRRGSSHSSGSLTEIC